MIILLFYIQRFRLIRAGKTHKNKEITNLFTVALTVNVPNTHLDTFEKHTSTFMHGIYILLFKLQSSFSSSDQ